jgi:Fe-Mn family superoxide dismutase
MMDRRELLVGGAAAAVWSATDEATAAPAPAVHKPGTHEPVPLPFNPAKLRGLSAALLTSHHDHNYVGAVKNLNKVETDLETITKDTPGFQVFGLRERQLTYTNSKIQHELYFANLGGDGKPGGAIEKRLAAQFGSAARWEEQFRAAAMSLGGGSGWVVLDASYATGALEIVATSEHAKAHAWGQPLLVLDMYEHSYAMDFGAAHAKYIDAFFANLHWAEVERRLAKADRVIASLRV